MNILSLNAGSATLKLKLFSMPEEKCLLAGGIDHSGSESIAGASNGAIDQCRTLGVDAIGHRVVHGGTRFTKPTRVNESDLDSLRALHDLDPLHNPTEVAMIVAGLRAMPNTPAFAVFDTAFHETMPEIAWRYALPHGLADQLALRRYGFHGISYQYVSERLLNCLKKDAVGSKLILCHLGNGASVCAVKDGISIDTSMGMTPVEGLVMGTRSGDVDPGLLLYLMRTGKLTPDKLDYMLNDQSGLLGLSERSGDVRDLEKAAAAGDVKAHLALDIFCYRICKYVGAYAVALSGFDALAFTGGIGEHSADVRQRICSRLQFLGIVLDDGSNNLPCDANPRQISAAKTSTSTWVVPTDEELQIARNVYKLLV